MPNGIGTKVRPAHPLGLNRIEPLECRRLLTTFTVTSNGDVGLGTLRQAIMLANMMPGLDTIEFHIVVGTPTIHPMTALPVVTGPTTIDGTTQPGYSPGHPVVFIEGTDTGPDLLSGSTDGLRLTGGGGSTVCALIIGGFANLGAAGIRVSGDGNVIAGNWLGTDETGAASDGNDNGVIVVGATNTLVGGTSLTARNVLSGNSVDGARFDVGSGETTAGNSLSGNYVGTTAAGDAALPNFTNGVEVRPTGTAAQTTDLTIGGTLPMAGNVISGNSDSGVQIGDVSGVRILGNRIGLDSTGTTAVPNDGNGVRIGTVDNLGLPHGVAGNITIGGTTTGVRNVISGNGGDGVRVASSASGIVVQGNYLGTDLNGATAVGNSGNGITILATSVLIGGGMGAEGNVISGNGTQGVQLDADGSVVENNLIGTAADGSSALPNAGNGIYVDGSDNVIGTPTTGNTIAYNDQTGIVVAPSPLDIRNAIRGNNIYFNGLLGIDLGDDGVTPNDPQDPDVGPNEFQNYPVLTSVTLSGSTATISGTLNSTPNSTFVLDFFASQIWDTTTFGEGQKYLSSTTVTTDAAGNASFTASAPGVPSGFNYFAATATDAVGNTSEFSYDPTPGAPAPMAAPANVKAGDSRAKAKHRDGVWSVKRVKAGRDIDPGSNQDDD